MRVLDDDGDFLEHVLEANASLLQPEKNKKLRVTKSLLYQHQNIKILILLFSKDADIYIILYYFTADIYNIIL